MAVQLPTNGPGTVVDTVTVGGKDRELVVIADPAAATASAGANVESLGTKFALDVNLAGSAPGVANVSTTITAAAQTIVSTVSNSGNGTIVLSGGTYTALTLFFEASLDGSNWFPIDVVRADGSTIINGAVGEKFTATGIRAWNFMAPGYAEVRVRVGATYTATVNPTLTVSQGPFLYDPSPTIAPVDGNKATYVASNSWAANIAGDIAILAGSATKLIRVTHIDIYVQGGGTITAAAESLLLVKRSSAASGGTTTATNAFNGPLDSLSPTATAGISWYTAAPTSGSVATVIRRLQYIQQVTGSNVGSSPQLVASFDFGNRPSQCPVLRGTAEALAINNPVAAVGTGPTLQWFVDIEWTEE